MGTSTGDVVDVAWLRTLMTDAVRQAKTGTARFAENTGEWGVEISFDLSDNPPERRIRGLHEAGSEVFVMGDNVRSSTAATAHFWDSRRAESSACGDPVRLIASLPDGSASVVRHSPATTTYELVADQQALADFCEQAHWPSDQPGLGATLATRWSVDAEGRPVSVAAADGRLDFPWDAIAFSDWGSPVEWATPPDLPAWQMDRPPREGELELQAFAVTLARMLGHSTGWRTATWVEASYPEAPGSRTYRTQARLWLVRPVGAGHAAHGVVVADRRWSERSTRRLSETDCYFDMLATGPARIGGRDANFLIIVVERHGGNDVSLTSTWTHHPELSTKEGAERLGDPRWVRATLRSAGVGIP